MGNIPIMKISSPVVKTPMGKVKGRSCVKPKNSSGAKQVYKFGKIPFAKPPLGDLRFEPPQKSESWSDVRDGSKSSPLPMQAVELLDEVMAGLMLSVNEFGEDNKEMSEDCLYLDVYTSTTKPTTKLPVLFWIYGGGFGIGSCREYNGSVLASLHDVIVVIPNYRVNVFGFLSLSGDNSPCKGNLGLLDQAMALQWVHDNIASFGGDPNNVTIFGESAGAISVGAHLCSPLSRGLFHRAISHSGVSDFPMCIRDDNDAAFNYVLGKLNIDRELDPKEVIEKLKKVPAEDLLKVVTDMTKDQLMLAVVKEDGKFFTKSPASVVEANEFAKVPYIIGINNTESMGLMAPGRDKNLGFDEGLKEKDGKELMKQMASMMSQGVNADAVEKALIEEYGRGLDSNDQHYWSGMIGDFLGDSLFLCNSLKIASAHANAGVPTYFYEMIHQTKFSHDPEYNLSKNAKFKSPMCKCDHSDDIIYTFGIPLTAANLTMDVRFTDEEIELSRLWMKYIVNFATTGDPNKGPHKKVARDWLKFDPKKNGQYLEVSSNPQMKENLRADRVKFWNETFPSLFQS